MITLLIDAHEKRDVATADVVGAYLLTTMDNFVMVKLTGVSAELMCKVNPTFKSYMVKEKGKNTLYLQLTRALYGCMQSALLWYNTFKSCLEDMRLR